MSEQQPTETRSPATTEELHRLQLANANMRTLLSARQGADAVRLAEKLAALEACSAWERIETCPKMTAVLLYADGYHIGHWNETNGKWWTYTDGTGTSAEVALNSTSKPTHWMPLPAAPGKKNPVSVG